MGLPCACDIRVLLASCPRRRRVDGYATRLIVGWQGRCVGWVTHGMLRRGCETCFLFFLALMSRSPLSLSLGYLSYALAWLSLGRLWCGVTYPWALGRLACLCLLGGRLVRLRCPVWFVPGVASVCGGVCRGGPGVGPRALNRIFTRTNFFTRGRSQC